MSITSFIKEIRKKLVEIDELLETIEILQNKQLLEELKEAEKEVQEGKTKTFTNLEEAFKWLDSEED